MVQLSAVILFLAHKLRIFASFNCTDNSNFTHAISLRADRIVKALIVLQVRKLSFKVTLAVQSIRRQNDVRLYHIGLLKDEPNGGC